MPVPGAHLKSDGSAGIGPHQETKTLPNSLASMKGRCVASRACGELRTVALAAASDVTSRLLTAQRRAGEMAWVAIRGRGGRQALARAFSRSPAAHVDSSAHWSLSDPDRGWVAMPGALYRRGRTGHLTVRGVAAASAILLIARMMRVLGHSALLALLGWIDVSGFRRGLCPLWVQALLGRGTDAMLRGFCAGTGGR